ncbi:hypothetical protein GQ600_22040 [Phytophthora cactorum]|nr:hypothetical protein GQ600_22040 [Phytophthora cactorum]
MRVVNDAGADACLVVCLYVTTGLYKRAAHPTSRPWLRWLVYNIPERIDVILTQRIAEFSKFPTSVQTAPKNGLTVTDPMLTGDYAGARKVALAYAWLDIDANACSCFLGTDYPGQVAYQMFIPQPIKKVLQLMGTCMVTVFVTLVDSQPSRPRQPG